MRWAALTGAAPPRRQALRQLVERIESEGFRARWPAMHADDHAAAATDELDAAHTSAWSPRKGQCRQYEAARRPGPSKAACRPCREPLHSERRECHSPDDRMRPMIAPARYRPGTNSAISRPDEVAPESEGKQPPRRRGRCRREQVRPESDDHGSDEDLLLLSHGSRRRVDADPLCADSRAERIASCNPLAATPALKQVSAATRRRDPRTCAIRRSRRWSSTFKDASSAAVAGAALVLADDRIRVSPARARQTEIRRRQRQRAWPWDDGYFVR